MANELLQGLLSNLLTPVDPREAQRAEGARLVSMMGTPGAAATYYAPQRAADFTKGLGQLFGMDQRTSADKLRDQLTKQAPDLSTSAGLRQLAQLAEQSGDKNTAAQLSLQATMMGTQEAQAAKVKAEADAKNRVDVTTKGVQIATGVSYLDTLIKDSKNDELNKELDALRNPVSSGAIPVADLPNIVKSIYERYKEKVPVDSKVDVKNYMDEKGKVLALSTNSQGQVRDPITDTWKYPGDLGLQLAADAPRSGTGAGGAVKADVVNFLDKAGVPLSLQVRDDGQVMYNGVLTDPQAVGLLRTTTTAPPVADAGLSENAKFALLKSAQVQGFVTNTGTAPLDTAFISAVNTGLVKDIAGVKDWFEGVDGTPAWNAKQKSIQEAGLSALSPSLNNLDQVMAILNDPASNIGGFNVLTGSLPFDTDQARLNVKVDSISSNAALVGLNKMKAEAQELGATGSGLGATQQREFEALMNSIENLKTSGQGREQITESIMDYQLHLLNIRNGYLGLPPIILKGDSTYGGTLFEDTVNGVRTNEFYFKLNPGDVGRRVILAESTADAILIAKSQRVGQ